MHDTTKVNRRKKNNKKHYIKCLANKKEFFLPLFHNLFLPTQRSINMMNHHNNKLDFEINPQCIAQLKENSTWYLLLGIGLVVLGTLAMIFAYTSTVFSVIYLGLLLMTVGGFEAFQAFKMSRWSLFFLHLILGILFIVGGFFMVMDPTVNAINLTLFLAIFFVVSGILKIIFAFAKHIPHKFWLVLNGVLTLVLGVLIWKQWPYSGLWVIGMFVGIDTIFTGWTWIMLSLAAKKMISLPTHKA